MTCCMFAREPLLALCLRHTSSSSTILIPLPPPLHASKGRRIDRNYVLTPADPRFSARRQRHPSILLAPSFLDSKYAVPPAAHIGPSLSAYRPQICPLDLAKFNAAAIPARPSSSTLHIICNLQRWVDTFAQSAPCHTPTGTSPHRPGKCIGVPYGTGARAEPQKVSHGGRCRLFTFVATYGPGPACLASEHDVRWDDCSPRSFVLALQRAALAGCQIAAVLGRTRGEWKNRSQP